MSTDTGHAQIPPPIARGVSALRAAVAEWRKAGLSVALVPTMGFLHHAHIKLIETAHAHAARTVVSLFVNPTQFGPREDFQSYPRDEAGDLAKLAHAGVELAYAPTVEEIYSAGFATTVSVKSVTEGLCGSFRPGHFDAVATVVAKLFLQCQPDVAVFGEKDYQQLLTVRRMVADLDMPIRIVAVPTQRDPDGMAASSRNARLSTDERARARTIFRVLSDLAARLGRGQAVADALDHGLAALRAGGIDRIDYLELRDAESLAPVAKLERPARLLTAVHVGATRLIDNVAVTPAG